MTKNKASSFIIKLAIGIIAFILILYLIRSLTLNESLQIIEYSLFTIAGITAFWLYFLKEGE